MFDALQRTDGHFIVFAKQGSGALGQLQQRARPLETGGQGEVAVADQRRVAGNPGLAQRIVIAGHSIAGQRAAFRTFDQPDPPVAQTDQVLGHGLGGSAVIQADGRMTPALDHFAGVDHGW
ncbi:hypothetical protein D3C85_1625260 [compost metagenome]